MRLREVLRAVGRQLTALHLVVILGARRPVTSLNLPALTPNLIELAFDPLKTPLRGTTAHGLALPDDGLGDCEWAKCTALDLLLFGDPTQTRPPELATASAMLPARKHAAWLEVADRVRPKRVALADFDSKR